MFVFINDNFIDINEIAAVTEPRRETIMAFGFSYDFCVILKSGNEIEISNEDEKKATEEYDKLIKYIEIYRGTNYSEVQPA